MHGLSNDDVELVKGATQLALHGAQRINVSDDFAERFLVREILRLHREGLAEINMLAEAALARLREHVQIKESAHRLAKPISED